MRSETLKWDETRGWIRRHKRADAKVDLVLHFGCRSKLSDAARYAELRAMFPLAIIGSCSTGGQIIGADVIDDEIVAVALSFDATPLKSFVLDVCSSSDQLEVGSRIACALGGADLVAVLVLADGLCVNGTELVAGISNHLGPNVRVFGGLAGDGMAFRETLVGINAPPQPKQVGAIGFYGEAFRVGTGAGGGWRAFGPKRKITKSKGAVLRELDGKPALDLYERYLGDEAKDLPASGLLFPLKIYHPEWPSHDIVRTLLAVDRESRSITFAGDLPEGWVAQLMIGSHDRLVAGASEAAQQARDQVGLLANDCLTLLISCVGRRTVMNQRVEDEIEAALSSTRTIADQIGFYSYGEISPHAATGVCEFHNQMMTVAMLGEASR